MQEEKFFEKGKKGTILFAVIFSVLFFGTISFAGAEEITASSTPVTFTVTVGNVTCKNGTGVASITLTNNPIAGGYYEVYGDMITKNNISLSREVELPNGSYTWKGITNSGYTASGKSSGEFIVGKCAEKLAPAQNLQAPAKPYQTKSKEGVNPEKIELSDTREGDIISTSTSAIATTTSNNSVSKERRIIGVVGFVLIAAIAGYLGLRQRAKKQQI